MNTLHKQPHIATTMQTKHATYIPFFALPVALLQQLPSAMVDSLATIAPFIAIFAVSAMFTCHLLACATSTLDAHVEKQIARQQLLAELPTYSISKMRSLCKQYNIPIARTYTKHKLFELLADTI